MKYKLLLSLVLAGLAVLFIVQNTAVVELQFLFWKLAMSRSLMIFFILIIGIVIGWLVRGYYAHRRDLL